MSKEVLNKSRSQLVFADFQSITLQENDKNRCLIITFSRQMSQLKETVFRVSQMGQEPCRG